MARPAGPGRTALINAGIAVAEQRGLAGLSVNAVVDAAGMAKGSFYQHFADRRDFLVALHRHYHDGLTVRLLDAVGDLPPGRERIRIGLYTWLDAMRDAAGTVALLLAARTDPNLFEETRARNRQSVELIAPDIAALGWDPPEPVAHMLVAMISHILVEEHYDGGPRDDLRTAALRLVEPRASASA